MNKEDRETVRLTTKNKLLLRGQVFQDCNYPLDAALHFIVGAACEIDPVSYNNTMVRAIHLIQKELHQQETKQKDQDQNKFISNTLHASTLRTLGDCANEWFAICNINEDILTDI